MKTTTLAIDIKKMATHSLIILAMSACIFSLALIVPHLASAATIGTSSTYCSDAPTTLFADGGDFGAVIKFLVCFLELSIVPFLFAIAIVVFFWGVIKFMAAGDASEKEAGQQFMLWGVIAIAVMFCVWGLVDILGQTFLGKDSTIIPQLPVN